MKLEATHLTEAQQCEIVAKLSKLNAPSKRTLGREYEVSEGAIRKVTETMRSEEPPTNDEIQFVETFVEFESATDFKGFETLLPLTSSTNYFAPMFKWKLNRCMMNCDDCLRRFSETSTNRQRMSSIQKFMHSQQITLHDMFKQ